MFKSEDRTNVVHYTFLTDKKKFELQSEPSDSTIITYNDLQ